MKNIFQKIKNRRKKNEQDVVCISIDQNNNTIVNTRNDNVSLSHDSRDNSFLSHNSLSGSDFAGEYSNKVEKSQEYMEYGATKPHMEYGATKPHMEYGATKPHMEYGEIPTQVQISSIELNVQPDSADILNNQNQDNRQIVTFNVKNMYNVELNFSDTYWNYQTFYNFWKNTIGECFFYVRTLKGSYEICKFEEIMLNHYTMIFVTS